MISGLVPFALNWSKDERGRGSQPAQGRGMPDVAYNLRRRLQWFLLLRVGLTTCLLSATVFLYYRHGGDNTPAGYRLLAALGCTYYFVWGSGHLSLRFCTCSGDMSVWVVMVTC